MIGRVAAIALLVGLVALGIAGIDRLADATQTRPDHQPAGTQTEIAFTVEVHGYRQGPDVAAAALWGVCSATVSSRAVDGVTPVGGHEYRVVVSPALGEHATERVRGCLNDLTIDRVRSSVVRMGAAAPA